MTRNLSRSIFLILFIFFPVFAQASNEVSNDLQERYAYCLKLMGDEQYQLAIKGFQKLLSDFPKFKLPYRNIVEAYIFLEDIEGATAYFKSLQAKNPHNPYIYYALARIDFHKGENQKAIEELKRCISLDPYFWEAYGPFGGLPEAYKAMNDLDSGEIFFKEFVEKSPRNPYAYYGLGRIYVKEGKFDKALQFYKKSNEIDSSIAYNYHGSLFIYNTRGEYKLGLKSAEKLLKLAGDGNDLEMVAYALLNIGAVYFLTGNFDKSLSYLNQSLQIASTIGAERREGMVLTNIGTLYATLGNKTKALEYYTRSLTLLRKTEAFRTEIRTLYNIGLIHKDSEQYKEAFDFLSRAQQMAADKGYQFETCLILTGLAETYNRLGQLEKSSAIYREALKIAVEIQDKARQGYILKELGDLYFELGDYDTAISYHSKALELGKTIRHAQIIWQANIGLGAAFQKKNETQKALYHFSQAISVYDSIRKNLNIESLVTGFLEDKYEAYPSIIHLLAKERKFDEAFNYMEKYKTKTLLKILAKGQFLISGLLPDSIRFSLIEIKNQLENAHSELSEELSADKRNEEKVLNLDQKITALELRKSSIIKSIKKNFNPYYQITSSEPVSLTELQRNILKPGQLVAEFVVGSNNTSVFLIDSDTLIYSDLPVTRDELQQMLFNLSPIFESVTSKDVKQHDNVFSPEQADFSIPPAFSLYATLFKPFEPVINHSEELIIIPDDILYYVPFEMLVTDTSKIQNRYDFANAQFFIDKTTISYLQSASLLNQDFKRINKPSKSLLAFGNPSFESKEVSQKDDQKNNIPGRGGLFQLPNSETEVRSISNLLGGSPQVYVGDDATEKIFKSDASDYRVIHLASHFEMNDQDPLYSKLAFSQKEPPDEDGYLQTYEVFNLQLNADLVVLSACNTALGKMSKGEGLIGISRAFLYAGVPSMVVSLWNVEDKATSTIMEYFYKYLKKGLNKNKALRMAKLDYLKNVDASKKDPFFWAPFVLFGNTHPIPFEGKTNYTRLTLYFILLMVGFVIGLLVLKKNRFHRKHN